MASKKLFLYLARRDKSGVRLLATFPGKTFPATKVKNLDDLDISASLKREMQKEIKNNRMLWQLWIEGASSFAELREGLLKRGYKNIPMFGDGKYFERVPMNKVAHKPSLSNLKSPKTMQRKGTKPS